MKNDNILIILGNQLFPIEKISQTGCKTIFMKEDLGLCTDFYHHKLKILFFFTAMREYRDYLTENGFRVIYHSLEDDSFKIDFFQVLKKYIEKNKINKINYFEIEDHTFNDKFTKFICNKKTKFIEHQSPMFLNTKNEFKEFANKNALKMSRFYQLSRKKFNILIDKSNKPVGGKWSFDHENRYKLPKYISIPPMKKFYPSKYNKVLSKNIKRKFKNHPGSLDNMWLPYSRKDALILLDNFLETRFVNFGKYEDAIKSDNNFLFHSFLSPIMNLGLITPDEIISKSIEYGKKHLVPLNSIEGFVRQIIGWREFIRGIYHLKGKDQLSMNFFNHTRKLSDNWYKATTGIKPLDDSIQNCLQYIL